MILRPELVFKYKPLSTNQQVDRLMNALYNMQLYFPRPSELNDPMEANSVQYGLCIAGSGYHLEAGKIHPIIRDRQDEFRILSFSTVANSSLMWTHYADEYKGCCLVFSTGGAFRSIEPVIYSDISFFYEAPSPSDELDQVIRESFLYKHTDWAYENEWRCIKRMKTNCFSFTEDDLVGIIVGENTSEENKKRIVDYCDEAGISCFLTYLMHGKNSIGFVPVEMDQDFFTPFEIQLYMNNREKQGLCRDNELYLFDALNDELITANISEL